jgi:hypothetical protein
MPHGDVAVWVHEWKFVHQAPTTAPAATHNARFRTTTTASGRASAADGPQRMAPSRSGSQPRLFLESVDE